MILLGAVSCDKESAPSVNFDRGPLLENLSDNLIIPGYNVLAERSTILKAAAEAFQESPTLENLHTLRERWLEAYLSYQMVAFYNFGPADEFFLNTSVNTFPTSKSEVDANIASGSYDLQAVSSNDAKGFSALDYLLYGLASDDETILTYYTSHEAAVNYKQYVVDVTSNMVTKANQVSEKWSASGGNYKSTFISRTGNDVGSSVGMLINAAVQYLERDLRDNKIGIPLGIRSLNVPIPNNCEALHAKKAVALATESIKALQHIYLGSAQSDGVGFDDYLSAINARYNGGSLNDAIKAQLALAVEKVSAIPEPYSETVENNPAPASQAYQELQKLTVLLKTDMVSSLGILITYQDNDGD